jgi:hypothetical protein
MIPNNWNEVNGNAAEQCAKCGMIFTVLRQDCPDEAILLIDGTGSALAGCALLFTALRLKVRIARF